MWDQEDGHGKPEKNWKEKWFLLNSQGWSTMDTQVCSNSHHKSYTVMCWPDQYEFVKLLKSTHSDSCGLPKCSDSCTTVLDYFAIPIPVPLFNNGVLIIIVIIKIGFKNTFSVSCVELYYDSMC